MAEDSSFIRKRAPTLYAIIAIKLLKGSLLLLLGLGVYRLHDNNLPAEFRGLLEFLHLDPESKPSPPFSASPPSPVIASERRTGHDDGKPPAVMRPATAT